MNNIIVVMIMEERMHVKQNSTWSRDYHVLNDKGFRALQPDCSTSKYLGYFLY